MIKAPDIENKTHFFNLPRRKIRYWCFRFQHEEANQVSSNGAPPGLREHFEKTPGFTGWDQFAVSWDLPHLKNCNQGGAPAIGTFCTCAFKIVPLKMVLRSFSVWEEWNRAIRRDAPVLKLKGKQSKGQAKSLSKEM